MRLLTQLGKFRVGYPSELLAARRRLFLSMAAQMVATRVAVDIKKRQWVSSLLQEPGLTVIRVLIAIFIAFLIAFVAHELVTGNVNIQWIVELLSP